MREGFGCNDILTGPLKGLFKEDLCLCLNSYYMKFGVMQSFDILFCFVDISHISPQSFSVDVWQEQFTISC